MGDSTLLSAISDSRPVIDCNQPATVHMMDRSGGAGPERSGLHVGPQQRARWFHGNHAELLVDLRPRHNPQFSREALAVSLPAKGIEYQHAALVGLRRPRPDSVNAARRNGSSRGFADSLQTGQFKGCRLL